MKTCLIIPAGGVGRRLELDIPKQFYELNGKPIIIHTLEKFQNSEFIDDIIIACHKDWIGFLKDKIKQYSISKVKYVLEGGYTRQESVANALEKIVQLELLEKSDIIMVHDSIRMFVDSEIIKSVIDNTLLYGAAIPGVELSDTIKYIKNNIVKNTLDRQTLRAIQTPQAARAEIFIDSYNKSKESLDKMTDDASVIENAGYNVSIAKGKITNFKITSDQDLLYAIYLLDND